MIKLWHGFQNKCHPRTLRTDVQPGSTSNSYEKVKFYPKPERIRILKFDGKQDPDWSRIQRFWIRGGIGVGNFRLRLALVGVTLGAGVKILVERVE